MPLVRIDILEGRPVEVRNELHRRVADLVAEVLDTPLDSIRTYITEIPVDGWAIGGVPIAEARPERVAALRRT